VDDEFVKIVGSRGEGWGEERVEFEVGPVGRGRDEHGEEGGFGCAVDLPEECLREVLDDPVSSGMAERTYLSHLISIHTT
jgi:hypothetical protein